MYMVKSARQKYVSHFFFLQFCNHISNNNRNFYLIYEFRTTIQNYESKMCHQVNSLNTITRFFSLSGAKR